MKLTWTIETSYPSTMTFVFFSLSLERERHRKNAKNFLFFSSDKMTDITRVRLSNTSPLVIDQLKSRRYLSSSRKGGLVDGDEKL